MIEWLAPRSAFGAAAAPCVGEPSGYPGILRRSDGKFCKASPVAGPTADQDTAWYRLDALLRDAPQVLGYALLPSGGFEVVVAPRVDVAPRLSEGLGKDADGPTWYGWPLYIGPLRRSRIEVAAERMTNHWRNVWNVRSVWPDRDAKTIRVHLYEPDGVFPRRWDGWPVVVETQMATRLGDAHESTSPGLGDYVALGLPILVSGGLVTYAAVQVLRSPR